MSVHNSHDDEFEPNPVVTLISKLDLSHPLHLHHNDSSTLTVVSIKLKGNENYNVWSCAMLLALEGRNKTSFIDNTCRRSNTVEVLGRQWDRVNVVLKETFDRVDDSVTFNLHHNINSLTQNGAPVAEYFNKLSTLWKQLDALLRSNILSRDPLLDAKGAYVLISSEESHRAVVIGSGVGSSQRTQSSIFNSSVNNRGGRQRSQTFSNTSRPKNVSIPNNNGNRKVVGGPTMVCEHCGFNGHTIDRCFKLIGYPANFRKKNNTSNTNQSNQNFNRRFMNSNNSVGSSSTFTFSDEQISKLISLITDNSLNDNGKGVQANMTSIIFNDNRHKVSHPNGTKALITKVGNPVLTNFLTLYD
ncbi:ribonuclease H-like domain-containing protein [Tanacetum coccineum]